MIDPQRVLNETEAGQKAKEELTTFTDNRRALVELEEKELKRMEEDLLKQASVLSANAKRGREERFRRRMIEYQQKVNEMNREVQVKQKEAWLIARVRESMTRMKGTTPEVLPFRPTFSPIERRLPQ